MTRVVVVGGSDAGISAGLRAREVDRSSEVTLVVADAYPNYSICGLPFFLSGETPSAQALAHRTRAEIESRGIMLRLETRAIGVDVSAKTLRLKAGTQESSLVYDALIVATGAQPLRPAIPGVERDGVFLLHDMADAFAVHDFLTARVPRSAVIIGAGYIGLEMADALRHRGLYVTVLDRGESVLHTVDAEIGRRVQGEVEAQGVHVANGAQATTIESTSSSLVVKADNGQSYVCDLVLVVVGVQPVGELAAMAGAALDARGAVIVNSGMATGIPNVWAAGDCAVTHHRMLPTPMYLPLGTTAHKQGRVAGENAVGGDSFFAGSLGTQVVKIFGRVIGRTGLRQDEAIAVGFDAATHESSWMDHKAYYPGATEVVVRVTADRASRKLLGAQIFGHYGAEVSKRLDVFATAVYHGMLIDDLWRLDLSYTPPLSSPWDPVQMSADAWIQTEGIRS